VFGISAQGGDYDSSEPDSKKTDKAAELRKLDSASERVEVVRDDRTTRDLTQPLAWLME
jgi:hypothetical protein